MKPKQHEELDAANELFNLVLMKNLSEEDQELRTVKEFNELSRREPEQEADESTINSFIQDAKAITEKLEKGEFKITKIEHANYGPDSDILSQINEQTYSISYRSNFGDISTEIERTVDPTVTGDKPLDANGNPIERTITDAINKSMPGDTILVKSGEYNESIVLDKAIQIKRFDENSNVEIKSVKGDAISLQTNCARIVGITISCSTPGDTYCVRSKIGILELEGCTLISHCAGCVRLERNARISAKDCTLHTNMFTSTSLMPGSKAVFDACNFDRPEGDHRHDDKIGNAAIPCITVDSDATCIVVNSRKIESSILFKPHSKGMIKGSSITSITSGIIVQDSAHPLISGCTITGCQRGLSLEGRSLGVFVDNTIEGNDVGVYATGVRNFIMRNNVIKGSKTLGVRVVKGSYCTFDGGIIQDSLHNGLQLDKRTCLIMKGVSFIGNKKSGLLVEPHNSNEETSEDAFVRLENCIFERNLEFGISIRDGIKLSMKGGTVQHNRSGGIRADACRLDLQNVECFENLGKELILCSSAEVQSTDCTFGNRPIEQGQQPAPLEPEEQQGGSIYMQDTASGTLKNCQWVGVSSIRSVLLKNNSKLTLSGCKLIEVSVGVFVTDKAECSIQDCEFTMSTDPTVSRAHRAIYMHKGGKIDVSKSRFKNGTVAIETFNGGTIDVNSSSFENIRISAVKLDLANATISDCSFEMAGPTTNIKCDGSQLHVTKSKMIGVQQTRMIGQQISNGKIAITGLPKIDMNTKKLVATSQINVDDSDFISFLENGIKVTGGVKLTVNNTRFTNIGRHAVNAENQCTVALNKLIFDQGCKILSLTKQSKATISGNNVTEADYETKDSVVTHIK